MSIQDTVSRLCSSYFRLDSPIPYQVDVDGGDVYMRWSTEDSEAVFIRRINTTGGLTTNSFTYALWSDRSTATYYYHLDNMQ